MIKATYIPSTDKARALTEEATRLACLLQATTKRLNAINAQIKSIAKEVVLVDVDEAVIAGTDSGAAARVAFGKKHFYANADELHNIKNVIQDKKMKPLFEIYDELDRKMKEKENELLAARIKYARNAQSGRVVVVTEGRKPQ